MSDAQEHREAAEQYETRVQEVKDGRKTGCLVHLIDDGYALKRMASGKIYVIHYEGIARGITVDGFFTGFYLGERMNWKYAFLASLLDDPMTEQVELAQFCKVFGARNESNFHVLYQAFTEANND